MCHLFGFLLEKPPGDEFIIFSVEGRKLNKPWCVIVKVQSLLESQVSAQEHSLLLKRPGFDSQHPHGGLQQSVTLVPGDLMPSVGTRHTGVEHSHTNTPYNNNNNNSNKDSLLLGGHFKVLPSP